MLDFFENPASENLARHPYAASGDETLPADIRIKARYQMALAYYAMDRFTDATEILNEDVSANISPEMSDELCKKIDELHKKIGELHKKIEPRLREQTHGKYNWFGLHKLASKNNGKMLDVANYVGPIAIAQMPTKGRGRGVITTRPVLAGELLIVAKLFVFASPAEFPKDLLRCCHPYYTMIMGKSAHELTGQAARRFISKVHIFFGGFQVL